MSELKTLKDINMGCDYKECEPINKLRIKAEAIKHIKKMSICHDCGKSIGEYHEDGCDEVRCKYCGGQALICDCEQEDKFRQLVGTISNDLIPQDFRKVDAIEWIKEFFNLTEEDLK